MPIDFPGSSCYVNVGNASSLQITGAMTVMAWMNATTVQNTEVVSKQTTGDRGFSLQTDDDPPDDNWALFVIAKTSSTTMSSGWPPSPLIPCGKYYHIAGQFVPSTAVQIWQDGELGNENTTSVPASMYDPSNNVTIANRPDFIGPFDGILDDVRIYNRNLSAAEMKTIYQARGRDRIVDGLVSRWLMNEGAVGATPSGSGSIKDIGPGGNHGTPSGSNVYAPSMLSLRK